LENLRDLLGTLKVGGTLTFTHKSSLGLGDPELYVIRKFNEGSGERGAIDSGFSVCRYDNSEGAMNTRSISRGYLNLYTFDMFDNLITTRIIVRDMTLVAVEVEA
jgi:hypothetical protein